MLKRAFGLFSYQKKKKKKNEERKEGKENNRSEEKRKGKKNPARFITTLPHPHPGAKM